ncbi:Cullin-4A, partial [Lunasporangiospora selenospora]
ASLSRKRKSSSLAARPSDSATPTTTTTNTNTSRSSSSGALAGPSSAVSSAPSSSSSSSSPSSLRPSTSSNTLPLRVLPVSALENSFARARQIEDSKRRRTNSRDSSHDSIIDSHSSIKSKNSMASSTGVSSGSNGLGLGSASSGKGLASGLLTTNGIKPNPTAVRRAGVQGRQPVKKLVIKNFTELYKTVENLCHQKYGDSLYKKLSAECESHVKSVVQGLLENTSDQGQFLEAVHKAWTDHCRQLIMIRSIFLYLDRSFVLHTLGVSSIWEMGLDLWRRLVMEQSEIRLKVLDGILALIEKDRKGEEVSYTLVTSLLRMLTDIHLYTSVFEAPFLQASRLYYHVEGGDNMHNMTPPDYLKYSQRRLYEETVRFEGYFDKSTRRGLIAAVEGELLERWADVLLQKGFEGVMKEHNLTDLKLWNDLMTRVNGLEKLSLHFGNYVKNTGKSLVIDPARDDNMVEELLKFKQSMDEVVNKCFQGSELFLHVLKECFESFINTRQNKPAELVAKYIDLRLRSGNKELSDEELESTLDRVLILFRYIQGKDVFEAFYKRDLAKRLLLNKSASFDAEKSMLSKLKAECGAGFTTKLEGMFKDMDTSKDIMVNFRTSKMYSKIGQLELNVNVLTQGNWPTYPPAEANIPDKLTDLTFNLSPVNIQISQCQEIFKEFYLSKHNGKRLMWQNSLGHSVVKAHFPLGFKELQLSLFQAIVLLLFNDVGSSSLSYKDIKQLSNIEPKELSRTLQSLACGKYRVLVKHPKSKDVNETDEFTFNEDFTASLTRIKINAIQLKETQEENASTNERIFQDRQFQVDAAIVRIMKMRKSLSHTLLISELFDQLKFAIKPSDLKKRIESLIDRDYLERDKNDQSLYKYVA